MRIVVRCINSECPKHDEVINTITPDPRDLNILNLKGMVELIVENWSDSHEGADYCPACSTLGEPEMEA